MSLPRATLSVIFISIAYATFGQNTDPEAQRILDKGKELDKAEKYDSAVVMYEKARRLFAPGSLGEAQSSHALGDVYKYVLYDFDKAEINYERALAIQSQIDPSNTRNLTRLYYNLATTNRSQHDYETAITWCLKAVEGSVEMKDDTFLERTYSILGNIYRDMHRFDSAVVYYQKGVAVNKSINKGKENETLAGLYSGWGDASYQQGDLDDASKKLTNAVEIYKRNGVRDKSIYLHTSRLLAEVDVKRNDLKSALAHLQVADDIRRDLNLERGGPVSAIYRTYGEYYLKRGDDETASQYYQKALKATTNQVFTGERDSLDTDKVEFKGFAYDALIAIAGIEQKVNTRVGFIGALNTYLDAEKLMIKSRSDLDTEDARWNYVDANFQLYENAISLLYQYNQASERVGDDLLLKFIDGSKSKSLADALQEAELKKALGRDDTLLTKLRDLRQQSLSLQHHINEKNESADRDQLIATAKQISDLEALFDSKYPSYLQTKFKNTSVDPGLLRTKMKTLDAAFVEYFWGEENIYVMIISGDSTGFYQIKNSADVETQVSNYTALFTSRTNQYSKEAVTEFSRQSHALYSVLIQPFSQQLGGRKRLIIVPDGPLMHVPFETLVTAVGDSYNQLPYLLRDHIISYVFSASHLLANPQTPRSNPSILAFGFTGGANERSPDDAATAEIAGSETELIALSNKFPRGTFLYGAGVTEKNFKDKAAGFDLLHLAVHGSGDTGEDYSATLYFRDKEGPEDGRLYWYELYNMNLRASLAVLSSCESGIGKTYRGEGMLSMANAFTFAGCGNIVMGLWKVDDQVSVRLMDTFYSELLDGMAIDEALAIAKRTYLASADQVSANPKLWGSLVAYGETPILRADEIPTSWVVVALTVLVIAIVLLVIKTRKK